MSLTWTLAPAEMETLGAACWAVILDVTPLFSVLADATAGMLASTSGTRSPAAAEFRAGAAEMAASGPTTGWRSRQSRPPAFAGQSRESAQSSIRRSSELIPSLTKSCLAGRLEAASASNGEYPATDGCTDGGGVGLGVAVGAIVGVGVDDGVAAGVGVGARVAVGVAVGSGVGVLVGDGAGVGEGSGVAVAVDGGVALGVAVGGGVEVGSAVGGGVAAGVAAASGVCG